MHILMLSAENGALPGAKVGGMGDVVGQIPIALAEAGCRVTVLTPSHGFLHTLPGAVQIGAVEFMFRGHGQQAGLFEAPGRPLHERVRHLVVQHPHLDACDPVTEEPRIYVDDAADRPFATDASRFALFCAAAATVAARHEPAPVDILHLHDWHSAFVLILRKFDSHFATLRKMRTIFSIHNLALQGIRPLRGDDSSLEAWFPGLGYDWFDVSDPNIPDCINAMAAGIRLADVIHTVSPAYADEILHPSRKPEYYGGEGLEAALQYAATRGKLMGILNGCAYPDDDAPRQRDFGTMLNLFKSTLLQWAGRKEALPAALFIAQSRLLELERRKMKPATVLASVGRVVPQKIQLMRATGSDGKAGLESILERLGQSGCLFLLGTGDPEYEKFLTHLSADHDNFIFLNGYSDPCARTLYANSDLFLMPSSFEPCGISQMLAMRDGQPCVVHAVGGLKDTVRHGVNGFSFSGQTLREQVDHFVRTTTAAVALKENDPARWQIICEQAAGSRFLWAHTARQYLEKLY
jgi:starch synthase